MAAASAGTPPRSSVTPRRTSSAAGAVRVGGAQLVLCRVELLLEVTGLVLGESLRHEGGGAARERLLERLREVDAHVRHLVELTGVVAKSLSCPRDLHGVRRAPRVVRVLSA